MGAPPVHGVFEQHIHCFLKPSATVEWSRPKRQKPPPLGGRSLRPFRLNFVPSDSGCSPVGILNGIKKGGCDWASFSGRARRALLTDRILLRAAVVVRCVPERGRGATHAVGAELQAL